jgi:hypothetical protein
MIYMTCYCAYVTGKIANVIDTFGMGPATGAGLPGDAEVQHGQSEEPRIKSNVTGVHRAKMSA